MRLRQRFHFKWVKIIKYLEKFHFPRNKDLYFLDVGCGSHSATISCSELKDYKVKYHGIDITRDYNNNEADFEAMDRFYEKDLTKLEFDDIPDNFYDVIACSQVIEHLYNGDQVIEKLLSKLKTGGFCTSNGHPLAVQNFQVCMVH